MRAYLGLVKIALQSRSAYRTEVFLHLFNQIVALFAQVAVWRALLGGTEGVTSSMGTVTLHEMVTYVVVSRGISVLVLLFAAHSPLRRMDDMIRSGQIAIELIKPLDLEASLFCEAVGANLFEVFFVLLPLAGIGVIVFEMDLPSWQNLPFFIITLINGFIIYFMISYTLGLLGFWYLQVWHLERLLADLITLLSGTWIPLWFFPPFLLTLSAFLPFRLIYFAPIAIYLGKMELADIVSTVLQQFVWMGILLVLERVLWARGFRKLVIQGG